MNNYSYIGGVMRRLKIEVCEDQLIHRDVVHQVKDKMLSYDAIFDLSTFFQVFSDETRLRILEALLVSELCVCDIASLLSMSQSSISHQLRTLRELSLVKPRKEGKVVYYSLMDDHIKKILDLGLEHVMEDENEKER